MIRLLRKAYLFPIIVACLIGAATPGTAGAQVSVVHAVLFYSPTCGHCEKVINEALPPIQQKYGQQLQITMVNVSTEQGSQLMLAAYNQKLIPSRSVPTLVISGTALVGDVDIPAQLPGLIESGLAQGGVALPDLAGLDQFTAGAPQADPVNAAVSGGPQAPALQATAETITQQPPASSDPIYLQRFRKDPVANSLAVVMLVIMVISLIAAAYLFVTLPETLKAWPMWVVPVLCILGLFVAGYLSYIEISHAEAVCGPVGNCNTVQQSQYSTLFGFLPVGVLGMLGYLAVGLTWLVNRYGAPSMDNITSLAMWGMTLFGVLFMVYLTFLEPFVIGATCAWCLTSAVLMTLLLWATTLKTVQVMNKE